MDSLLLFSQSFDPVKWIFSFVSKFRRLDLCVLYNECFDSIQNIFSFINNHQLYHGPLFASKQISKIVVPLLDPSVPVLHPLKFAISNGFVDLTKRLLKDPRVKICFGGIELFIMALDFDQFEILKLLCNDPRFDLSKMMELYGETAIRLASKNNEKLKIVKYLFNHPKSTIPVRINCFVESVVMLGDLEFLIQILNCPELDPDRYYERVALNAGICGHAHIVEFALRHQFVPRMPVHKVLFNVLRYGHHDCVKLFLMDKRFSGSNHLAKLVERIIVLNKTELLDFLPQHCFISVDDINLEKVVRLGDKHSLQWILQTPKFYMNNRVVEEMIRATEDMEMKKWLCTRYFLGIIVILVYVINRHKPEISLCHMKFVLVQVVHCFIAVAHARSFVSLKSLSENFVV
jgi:hypothetical protein